MYFVTYPILFVSLLFAGCGMVLYFELKEKIMEWNKGSAGGIFNKMAMKLPGICYASIIFCVNHMYGKLAVMLNDWGKLIHIIDMDKEDLFLLIIFANYFC